MTDTAIIALLAIALTTMLLTAYICGKTIALLRNPGLDRDHLMVVIAKQGNINSSKAYEVADYIVPGKYVTIHKNGR